MKTLCAACLALMLLLTPSLAQAWQFEGGSFSTTNTYNFKRWDTVTFASPFDTVPLVFVMAENAGGNSTAPRIRNVTRTGFEVILTEPGDWDGPHVSQDIFYYAAEPGIFQFRDGTIIEAGSLSTTAEQHGAGNFSRPPTWDRVSFAATFDTPPVVLAQIQTLENETGNLPFTLSRPFLTTALRNITTSGVELALERGEDPAGTVNVPETVGYLVMTGGVQSSFVDIFGKTIVYETRYAPQSVRGWGDGCSNIDFGQTYSRQPLAMAHTASRIGSDGGWTRRCSLTRRRVGLTIDEDTARDSERNHTAEDVSIIVLSENFVADDDRDRDGIDNYTETLIGTDPDNPDTDGDGISDFFETEGGLPNVDFDGDGLIDALDVDDDNDGVHTRFERPSPDGDLNPSDAANTDGTDLPDYHDVDDDNDGLLTAFEDGDPNGDGDPADAVDTDANRVPDYRDPDDDGDARATASEVADPNGDGRPEDAVDTDADGTSDYRDPDDDGDGVLSRIELELRTDPLDVDSDADGLDDFLETDGGLPINSDGQGVIDALDTDSDDDSLLDAVEGAVDSDGDGVGDWRDPDDDNDGIPTLSEVEAAESSRPDPDNDGLPAWLDLDSDGDTLPDATEVSLVPLILIDSDNDGIPNFLTKDSDSDGVTDEQDNCRTIPNPDQADINGNAVGDACEDLVELCDNRLDDDGDGAIDCEDPDCTDDPLCFVVEDEVVEELVAEDVGEDTQPLPPVEIEEGIVVADCACSSLRGSHGPSGGPWVWLGVALLVVLRRRARVLDTAV